MDPASSFSLIAAIVLVLFNAFFVAAEFAIIRVRPTRLEQLAAAGDSRAATAIRVTRRLDSYISAAQLGITLASLGVGWLGEPAFAHLILGWLAPLGITESTAHTISIVVAFILITMMHVIIGETAPKTLAINSTVPVTLWLAKPLHWFYLVTWPVNWVMNTLGNGFVRLFGMRPAGENETHHTAEELRLIISRSPGILDPQIRQMMVRVLDYRRRKARHVMTIASEISALRSNQTIEEATKVALESRYTRYPVLDTITPRVLGFIHMQDLFSVYAGVRKATRLVELMREPLFALDDTPIDKLRLEMQSRQLHLAIITNAEGLFVGIVTLEDLLEEIVGEIRDESDEEVAPISRKSADVFEVGGRVLLEDLERETSIALKPAVPDAETVQAYVQKRLGSVLKAGDRVECEGYLVIVIEALPRRVGRVRIIRREQEPLQPDDGSAQTPPDVRTN
ncbi:MAG: HlyC/CorC family transporter [Deltaproteobacteria bacterium]|nr:HlyC/CorC family transporter [Deltaproteobacteria bacterium]